MTGISGAVKFLSQLFVHCWTGTRVPQERSNGPVVRRASFFVRLLLETPGGLPAAETERRREALTGCAANVSSLLSETAETFYFTSL